MARAQRRLSVGMFVPGGPEPTGKETVTGVGVAVTTFVRMLERYASKQLGMVGYTARELVDGMTARLQAVAAPRKRRFDIRATEDLVTPSDLPDLWHDINADVRRPFALRHAAATRFPISITHHTVSYTSFVHDWFLPLLLGDVRPYDTVICTSTAARTAIANVLERLATDLERAHGVKLRYRGRLDVLPLGVDTDAFRIQPHHMVRDRLGLPIDRKIVLWIGRFSAHDKADLLPLVRAFARATADKPQAKAPLLVLAGTDRKHDSAFLVDYAAQLGIAKRVRVVTGLDPSVRHDWFAAADVFVSPVDNIQETFGLTPIEAMACGVPVIVSDWNGYRDTVVDGEHGFRIPTRWTSCGSDLDAIAPIIFQTQLDHLGHAQAVAVDTELLEARLRTLLDDADLCKRMAIAGRQRALDVYAWDRVIARYETLWHEQVAVARRTPFRTRPHGAWSLMHAYDAFAHYATEQLAPTTRLVATDSARAVITGDEVLPTYHADGVVLDADVIEDALTGLVARGTTLGALAKRLHREHDITPDAATRAAMWLLKYGFARVASTSASTSTSAAAASPARRAPATKRRARSAPRRRANT